MYRGKHNYILALITVSITILPILCVNRQLICAGILRIYWMHFTSKIFDVQMSCNVRGHILQSNRSSSSQIRDETLHNIDKKLTAFQRAGYMYFVIGVLMNLAWIAVVYVLRRNIAYNPNSVIP